MHISSRVTKKHGVLFDVMLDNGVLATYETPEAALKYASEFLAIHG